MSLSVVIFDQTCREIGGVLGLSSVWSTGAALFRTNGRFDAVHGVASWHQAFAWLAALPEPLAEVQFWGHGTWGAARVGTERFDASSLEPGHVHHPDLSRLKQRFIPGGLFWFRTCQTLGRAEGKAFAQRLSRFLDVRVAGHTGVIAWAHSGLHCVGPDAPAAWEDDEGVRPDGRPRWSQLHHPRTIPFWRQRLPGWAEGS
ncbi:MAG: hypothetical protein AAGD10_04520 [Myxococcota bacterium]